MKFIYRISAMALVLFIATSCGSQIDDTAKKTAELEKLKQEHSDLDAKIRLLEAELNKNDESTKRTISVELTDIKKELFSHYLEVQGRVDGEDNIAVSAQMAGVITGVYVKEGDKVKKGQTLAQIENSSLRETYEATRTLADLATSVYNKRKALWEQQIGSEVEYLGAKAEMESRQKSLAAIGEQIEMSKIKSPINGTVEEVNLKVGQMASPGMPAIRVVNFSTVKVVADIAESYASKVRPGAKVLVTIPDLGKDIEAKVDFTSKYINPVNRTFLTEIRLKPGVLEYRANMIAKIRINDYSNSEAIVVPVSILRETNDGRYVFVAENVKGQLQAKRRAVEVGQTYNGQAEITKGLLPGDKLITTGFSNLVDGQPLKVS